MPGMGCDTELEKLYTDMPAAHARARCRRVHRCIRGPCVVASVTYRTAGAGAACLCLQYLCMCMQYPRTAVSTDSRSGSGLPVHAVSMYIEIGG